MTSIESSALNQNTSRRRFLQASGAWAGLAATSRVRPIRGAENQRPLRVGLVGSGGRGTYLMGQALTAGVEVPAICDIKPANLQRAQQRVAQARGGRMPEGYGKGPTDYERMLARDDLDAIIIGTGMQIHAPIAVCAMRAGKHVLSEVAAAMTVDDCWALVRTQRETGKTYMMAENCCYWDHLMTVGNMVDHGLFGQLTYAECGYVHDCRGLLFEGDGRLTWRGEMVRDNAGDNYPTHNLGPVARWLGINRGDRIVSLVSRATGHAALDDYIAQRFPAGHSVRKVQFRGADSVSTLIRTAKGVVIDVRYDIMSSRPAWGPYHALQGTRGSFESRTGNQLWLADRTKGRGWEPLAGLSKEFEHPKWTKWREIAKSSGHGGGDFFVVHEFLETIRSGGPSPVDACDAATWSSIIPLSAKSVSEGSTVQQVPDFTEGKWQKPA